MDNSSPTPSANGRTSLYYYQKPRSRRGTKPKGRSPPKNIPRALASRILNGGPWGVRWIIGGFVPSSNNVVSTSIFDPATGVTREISLDVALRPFASEDLGDIPIQATRSGASIVPTHLIPHLPAIAAGSSYSEYDNAYAPIYAEPIAVAPYPTDLNYGVYANQVVPSYTPNVSNDVWVYGSSLVHYEHNWATDLSFPLSFPMMDPNAGDQNDVEHHPNTDWSVTDTTFSQSQF